MNSILRLYNTRLGIIVGIAGGILGLLIGIYFLQIAECGIQSRTLSWLDIGTPDVEQGYKDMYNACHNIFGQDYSKNFDSLLKFYPSLQSWRNSQ